MVEVLLLALCPFLFVEQVVASILLKQPIINQLFLFSFEIHTFPILNLDNLTNTFFRQIVN